MPNWCENTVLLQGTKELVDEVKRYVEDEESAFCFDNIVPMPEGLVGTRSPAPNNEIANELIRQYGHPSWYEWSVVNWGTKWDTTDVEVDEWELHNIDGDPIDALGGVTYRFLTAWSPPIPVMQALSEKFPDVHIQLEYDEPGNDFWGFMLFSNGEIVHEEEGASRINENMLIEEELEEFLEVDEDVADDDF